MSFPNTLSALLTAQGLRQTGDLSFVLPTSSLDLEWHVSFRTLGFAKDQIDGALRYRHNQATDFAWACLTRFGGRRWEVTLTKHTELLSPGVALGPLLGWRPDHTFDNRGLTPDESATQISEEVRAHVLPYVERSRTSQDLYALLCSDEEPWSWWRSQGLLRVAEIAKLEVILGVVHPKAAELAKRFETMMQDQLDEVSLDDYLAQTLSIARDS
jgi:hypothetical protein